MTFLPFDYSVRNLLRSPLRLIATIAGSLLVVLLVITAAAFVRGMQQALTVSSGNRNVIVLGAGSEESLERSQISPSVPGQFAAAFPGIRHTLGVPHLSPEIHLAMVVQREPGSSPELRAFLRGVTAQAFLVHPQVEIIEGHAPRQGHDELLVGALAAQKLGVPESVLAPGNSLWFAGREWKISGRFRAPATAMQAEIWLPLSDLQVASKNEAISCVIATLGPDTETADVEAWAKTRLDLELAALSESEYYSTLRHFYRPIHVMVWVTAALMALAGLLGGLNTLYAAFAARTREVGMLQSLGFSRLAIFVGILQESLLSASTGALIAAAIARLALHGVAVRFSLGVFQLTVDSPTLSIGLAVGLAVGILGAIPPTAQCFRLPIASALKAT